jgi:hypothetical protein
MAKEYSPFTPGQPVPVEFFVGRIDEINRLKERVAQAATGRLQVAFLSGERGIGKSSLASFVRQLGERDHQMLGLHTFLGGVDTLEEMARRVFDRLLKESIGTRWHEKIKAFFGNRIRKVGLFGVAIEFEAPTEDLRRLVNDFVPALRNLSEELKGEKAGLFVVLDDINGLAESSEFANWLKSLVDEIATGQVGLPLCLVLVGLEERRHALVDLQPSLGMVFDLVDIRAWSEKETQEFFKEAFGRVHVSVDDEALRRMASFASGLPVLAHEIGDAAFNADNDGRIDGNDAWLAIFAAADVVGRKHLQPQVLQAVRSTRYRSILRTLGQEIGDPFTRGELKGRLRNEEVKVLDNFLARMKELGVIRADPAEGVGAYRFVNRLFYAYFTLEAVRARRKEEQA